jgi:hypothetical protein
MVDSTFFVLDEAVADLRSKMAESLEYHIEHAGCYYVASPPCDQVKLVADFLPAETICKRSVRLWPIEFALRVV